MSKQNWYKGNLHTHTTESDGDADPAWVANWFKEHGYDFLVLSDHNHRTILVRSKYELLSICRVYFHIIKDYPFFIGNTFFLKSLFA